MNYQLRESKLAGTLISCLNLSCEATERLKNHSKPAFAKEFVGDFASLSADVLTREGYLALSGERKTVGKELCLKDVLKELETLSAASTG